MHINDFTYDLPESKIAMHPPIKRGSSRLLILNQNTGSIENKHYYNFTDYINEGDVIVLNDTKVIKARLTALSKNDKKREFLLLERHSKNPNHHLWKTIYKGKVRSNEEYYVGSSIITVKEVLGGGIATIASPDDLLLLANSHGSVPLPPYIKRHSTKEDEIRYQTEFAYSPGSVAAPTASLNFTNELQEACKTKGATIVYLTLHVGLGTFLPIRTELIQQHKMHSEYFEIPVDSVTAIQAAKKQGNKVFAIGTTVARTLEYAATNLLQNVPQDLSGEANIFIYPGYSFKVVDGLLTNFHAPKTTVLMLAATFAGWDNLKTAYDNALQNDYRFLSYGDSMLIY